MATDTALYKSPSTSHVVRVTAGLGVTQLISWGTVFVPPPIFAASIAQDLQIELETVFLGITVMLLVSALVGPTLGRILDKVGSRQPMIYGALGASLGFLLLGSAPNTFVFWSAWIVLGLVAPLVLSNGCYAALSQLAGHRSRRAISSLTLFSGSAIAIFYPIAYFLDETIGWRSACLLFASLHLFISTPIFLSLIPRSKDAFASSAPPPGVHQPLEGRRRAVAFYALFILMAIHALVSNGLLLNFINLYEAFEIDKGVCREGHSPRRRPADSGSPSRYPSVRPLSGNGHDPPVFPSPGSGASCHPPRAFSGMDRHPGDRHLPVERTYGDCTGGCAVNALRYPCLRRGHGSAIVSFQCDECPRSFDLCEADSRVRTNGRSSCGDVPVGGRACRLLLRLRDLAGEIWQEIPLRHGKALLWNGRRSPRRRHL